MRMLCVAAGLLLAGCAEPTVAAAEVFVLEYHIVDLDGEPRSAEPGHHCGDAAMAGGALTVWLWPEEERPDGPWLAVFPHVPDHWHASIGEEPFKTTFPATVDPRVQADAAVLGELEWQPGGDHGILRVDGNAVSVPHSWSVQGGGWRADATLSAWDGPVQVERFTGLCD